MILFLLLDLAQGVPKVFFCLGFTLILQLKHCIDDCVNGALSLFILIQVAGCLDFGMRDAVSIIVRGVAECLLLALAHPLIAAHAEVLTTAGEFLSDRITQPGHAAVRLILIRRDVADLIKSLSQHVQLQALFSEEHAPGHIAIALGDGVGTLRHGNAAQLRDSHQQGIRLDVDGATAQALTGEIRGLALAIREGAQLVAAGDLLKPVLVAQLIARLFGIAALGKHLLDQVSRFFLVGA